MQPKIWAAGLCVIVLAAVAAQADTVKTNDGRTFTGLIVKDDDSGVVIDAMIRGIRSKVAISARDVSSKVKAPLPKDFFEPPKPATQPSAATQPAPTLAGIDPQSQAQIDKLKKEIESLRKEQAEFQKRLRVAPAKVRKVYRGQTLGPCDSAPRPDSIAVEEPNPQIPALKEKIEATRDAIAAKNKEIVDLTSPATEKADLSESKVVLNRLQEEIKGHRENLSELQKKLAKTPAKTDWHRLRPGEGLGDMMRKRNPEPNPDYLAIQEQIKKVQALIGAKNKQVLDITRGGPAGQAVLDEIRQNDTQTAAEKAKEVERREGQRAAFVKEYNTPQKASDFCVKDLMANGIVKTATRTAVGEIQGKKARWMLTSGQWATAPFGVGVAAPGAALPDDGPPRRPGAKGAEVSYTFTFVTQAGLLREYNGYVLVANIDGFWEPWGYDIDGVSAPPYKGRQRYEQAEK